MTSGACHGQPEEGFTENVDLVVCAVTLVLADIDRGVDLLSEEWPAGSKDGFVCLCFGVEAGRSKEVASKVLCDKVVVGNVAVKGPHQVVSIPPRVGDSKIALMSAGFCVTNKVHPVARPAFAVVGRSKQSENSIPPSVLAVSGEELFRCAGSGG